MAVLTFAAGRGPIHMDNLACTGSESTLAECLYDPDTSDCVHREDAGVRCLVTRKYLWYDTIIIVCLYNIIIIML